jgi:4-hydroxy-3-methylbut-2-en-1-yl diphosphate reductase
LQSVDSAPTVNRPKRMNLPKKSNIELIDATCPVVITLQERVKKSYEATPPAKTDRLVIYGKKGHAEIEGLNGQTEHNAIIIESIAETDKIDT